MRAQVLLNTCVIVGLLHATCAGQEQSVTSSEVRQHAEGAKSALARNDLAAAQREYRAIVQLDPTNADAYAALGVALYGSGKFGEAVATLNKSLELEKNQPRAELFLALSESGLGHCDKVIPTLSSHFSSEPDLKLRRLAGLSLLDCEIAASDPASALPTAEQLHSVFPDDPDVLYKSAELYTRLWNQTAGELMEKHPESYRVHQLAGEVFEAQEKNEQAIKEFRLALEENPRVPQLHFRIGELLLKQNSNDAEEKALAEFQQELAVNPESGPAEYEIGEIYRTRRSVEEATRHFQRAIQRDPEFAEPHIGLAQIFIVQRQYEKAREQLETAIRLQPENATAHYNLMLAYRGEGNLEGANREMAAFEKLQQKDDQGFQNKLHSLLTGTSERASHAK